MVMSKRGLYENPAKSPWNFERYDSDMERRMMTRLDADAEVIRWQKRHSVTIPWIDPNGARRSYHPDFLVEYADGRKAILEVKNPMLFDSPAVLRKENAAREWCRKRGMTYVLATQE